MSGNVYAATASSFFFEELGCDSVLELWMTKTERLKTVKFFCRKSVFFWIFLKGSETRYTKSATLR